MSHETPDLVPLPDPPKTGATLKPSQPSPGYFTIGSRIPLVDSAGKVSGQAVYTDDMKFPGMLVAKILRSTKPHAKIVSIDTSKAEALPGVRAVMVGSEAPISFGVLPISEDETALAVDKVRHTGEGVVGIAADDEATLEEAMKLVEVVYEPLTEYLKAKKGLTGVQDRIHNRKRLPEGSNIHKAVAQDFGDVDKARDGAAHTVTGTWDFESVNHAFTEPHCTICHWSPDGRLHCYTAQQVPHYLHRAMSKVFEMPMERIRIFRPTVGGGFGGKSDPFPHEMVCALLAKKAGKPVKLLFEREEVFLSHHGRHPTETKLSLGCDGEGMLTYLDLDATIDGGAFGSFGVVTTYYNGVLAVGPYHFPNFRYNGRRVYTNKPVCGAMRGHGAVNTRMALETALDDLAVQRGENPFDLRLRNLLDPNETTVNGFRITSIGIQECLDVVRKASDFDAKWGKMPKGRGIGLGCGFYISGSAKRIHWNKLPQSTVHLKIDMDGGITLHSMAAEIGQGSDTMLAQCVAEELKCPIERIRVLSSDSDTAPIDLGSYSSRVTFMAGNAARRAAKQIAAKLIRAGSKLTGYPEELLELDHDHVLVRTQGIKVPYLEVLQEALAHNGALIAKGIYGDAPPMGGSHKGAAAGLSPTYSYQAFVAEVEVDEETGFIRVEKIWAAHDAGKALNRLAVEGQIEGSVHMGVGQALTEVQDYLPGGMIRFPNLLDYKIPLSKDVPEIEVLIVESEDPEGPYGAKECGEGALAPVLPAVANAVYDAIGVRMHEMPMTPDRVFKAIEKDKKRKDRHAAAVV